MEKKNLTKKMYNKINQWDTTRHEQGEIAFITCGNTEVIWPIIPRE